MSGFFIWGIVGHSRWALHALRHSRIDREAPVRFGSVTVWRWNGSSGSGFRFRRFLCKKVFFSVLQYSLTGKDGCGSGFGSWKTVPVPLSVSGKTVPTVPTVPVPVRVLSHPVYRERGNRASNRVLVKAIFEASKCLKK